VASDDLRDALSVIFGLSELKEISTSINVSENSLGSKRKTPKRFPLKSQSMVAEKDDISETIVKVDSQMMIQKNDVCSQQFRPQTSMSNDV
ncbi:hypothetical protein Tco_1052543, partial [Tanacetum coccineum]